LLCVLLLLRRLSGLSNACVVEVVFSYILKRFVVCLLMLLMCSDVSTGRETKNQQMLQ